MARGSMAYASGARTNWTGGSFDPSGPISVLAIGYWPANPATTFHTIVETADTHFRFVIENDGGADAQGNAQVFLTTCDSGATGSYSDPGDFSQPRAPVKASWGKWGLSHPGSTAVCRYHSLGQHWDGAGTAAAGAAGTGLHVGSGVDGDFQGLQALLCLWNAVKTDAVFDSVYDLPSAIASSPLHLLDLGSPTPRDLVGNMVLAADTGSPVHSDLAPFDTFWRRKNSWAKFPKTQPKLRR